MVTSVMTDIGSCYRSRTFAAALGLTIRYRRTRPYQPQTSGMVDRFNRTLLAEFARATVYASDNPGAVTYQEWIQWYNLLTFAQRVHNLTGKYSRLLRFRLMSNAWLELAYPQYRLSSLSPHRIINTDKLEEVPSQVTIIRVDGSPTVCTSANENTCSVSVDVQVAVDKLEAPGIG